MMIAGTIRPWIAVPFSRIDQTTRWIWAIFSLAVKKFLRIDGAILAGAFGYSMFFSLFPLIILLVTVSSTFVHRDRAVKAVIAYIQGYVPIGGEMQHTVFDTITSVIEAREQASAIAFLILVWTSLQCFITLISATHRAWDIAAYNWWGLPLKSLMLLVIITSVVLLSMTVSILMRMVKGWLFSVHELHSWVYSLGNFIIPLLMVFIGLSLFYWLAPRRPTRFAEVWGAALCVTLFLRASEVLFIIYLKDFATLNAVYGAFGGIMALLMWIYISGCICIFGVCLCAGQVEMRSTPIKIDISKANTKDLV